MKKIIIIGAGIAGLAAGIYARKNGYDVTIYESHFLPGGMCTAWKRKGFTFEGCMHFIGLLGASPAHVYYKLWRELGVVPGTKIFRHEIFQTFRDAAGRVLNIYTNAGKLQKELLALSPADRKEIKNLCALIKRYAWFIRAAGRNPFLLIAKFFNILRTVPFMRPYVRQDMGRYAARFKDPLIRSAFARLFIYPDPPSLNIFFFLAAMHLESSGYPRGGSLVLARTIENTFLGLKGNIKYKKTAKRIIVRDNRAVGIELDDGTRDEAGIVISAADGHATLFDMLEGRFTTPELKEQFNNWPVFPPLIQVSMGVNRDLGGTPHAVKAEMPVPFEIAGKARKILWYHHYGFDATIAPKAKASVTVLYDTVFTWWQNFKYQSEAYRAEKKKILNTTVAQLEKVLPGITSQIEAGDVATPFTSIRYTHNRRAAIGFMVTEKAVSELVMKPQYTLPGLDNFYRIGQWVNGLGVPPAAANGKEVIRRICKADRRKFKSA